MINSDERRKLLFHFPAKTRDDIVGYMKYQTKFQTYCWDKVLPKMLKKYIPQLKWEQNWETEEWTATYNQFEHKVKLRFYITNFHYECTFRPDPIKQFTLAYEHLDIILNRLEELKENIDRLERENTQNN